MSRRTAELGRLLHFAAREVKFLLSVEGTARGGKAMKPMRHRGWAAAIIGLGVLAILAVVVAALLGVGGFNYVDETVEIQLVSPS
jgi:hypothetical protein